MRATSSLKMLALMAFPRAILRSSGSCRILRYELHLRDRHPPLL